MKERFAAWLLAERARRGGGDPRRFAQPEMASLVGIGLRQYQRWEDPDDPSLPTWSNIEAIGRRLEADVSELFALEVPPVAPLPANDRDRLEAVEARLSEVVTVLERLADRVDQLADGQASAQSQ